MSNLWLQAMAQYEQAWESTLPDKVELSFENEMRFINRALLEDIRLQGIATNNPRSLESVLMHQARTGLSLDPGIKHAYLGLRDGRLLFMPGYKGLTEIGIQEKLILSCTPELVFKNDHFVWHDGITPPDHVLKHPFGTIEEVGDCVGGFCTTKRSDGEFIVTKMSIEELLEVRDYALHVNENPEQSAWFDLTNVRIWSMFRKTLQRRNTDNWAFGNCPRMVAAISYATPDHLDAAIEKAQQGASPDVQRESGTQEVSVEPSSSVDDLDEITTTRIKALAANAEKYSLWETYKGSVKESYGKNRKAYDFAMSLVPTESQATQVAATTGVQS